MDTLHFFEKYGQMCCCFLKAKWGYFKSMNSSTKFLDCV